MTPRGLLQLVIRPVLAALGRRYASPEAELLLVAIALQESGMNHRRQIPRGPARSWWQIEPQTAANVAREWDAGAELLGRLGLLPQMARPTENGRWLEASELGACTIARGILWMEPSPLPALGDSQAAWTYYAELTWRPGRPQRTWWDDHYWAASRAVARDDAALISPPPAGVWDG